MPRGRQKRTPDNVSPVVRGHQFELPLGEQFTRTYFKLERQRQASKKAFDLALLQRGKRSGS